MPNPHHPHRHPPHHRPRLRFPLRSRRVWLFSSKVSRNHSSTWCTSIRCISLSSRTLAFHVPNRGISNEVTQSHGRKPTHFSIHFCALSAVRASSLASAAPSTTVQLTARSMAMLKSCMVGGLGRCGEEKEEKKLQVD